MSKKILIVVIIVVLAAAGFYWKFISSPKYALYQVQKAIASHDKEKFQQYVDISTVSSSAIDQAITQFSSSQDMGMMALGAMFIKPQLTEALRQQVLTYVETGNVTPGNTPQANGMSFDSFVNSTGKDSNQFKGIAYTKEEGDIAIVGLEFDQPGLDTSLVLDLKMRHNGDHWQVIEISNFADFMKKRVELEKKIKN